MGKVVFVLGAGTSKDAGVPIMSDFLWRARDLSAMGKVSSSEAFGLVFQAIAELQAAYAKARIDIDNLESVFTLFEMAQTVGRLGSLKPDQISRLAAALVRVIVETIEQSYSFVPPQPHVQQNLKPAFHLHRAYAELLKAIRDSNPPKTTTTITFNYDVGLDLAFAYEEGGIDYALGSPRNSRANLLLKLHGSINWGYCKRCKKVVPVPVSRVVDEMFKQHRPASEVPFTIGSRIKEYDRLAQNHECPNGNFDEVPLIVPPSWYKADGHRLLANVWKVAAEELSEAEYIVVIGYSLPESDAFFRNLFAIGASGPSILRRFVVIDPAPKNGTVDQRFDRMLGGNAVQKYHYQADKFAGAIKWLKSNLI